MVLWHNHKKVNKTSPFKTSRSSVGKWDNHWYIFSTFKRGKEKNEEVGGMKKGRKVEKQRMIE